MTPPESPTTVCYRHPDRPTRVSCGRCGKYLCPDCIHFGPVGVRCADCLRMPRAEVRLEREGSEPLALAVTLVQAVVWCAGLTAAAYFIGADSPNIFLSAFVGGALGLVAWLIGGRVCTRRMLQTVLAAAAGAPLAAALILAALHPDHLLDWHTYLRALLAAGIAVLVAWIAATRDW